MDEKCNINKDEETQASDVQDVKEPAEDATNTCSSKKYHSTGQNPRSAGDVLESFFPQENAVDEIADIVRSINERMSLNQPIFPSEDHVDKGGDISEDDDDNLDDMALWEQPYMGMTLEQPRVAEPIIRDPTAWGPMFRYRMNHPERGCFIIFNHKTFDYYNEDRREEGHLCERKGTDKDALNLENTAKQLGFEYVKIINDATRSEITQWIDTLAKADHSNYDCFGCAILTHGGDGDVLYARDKNMNLTDFTRSFGPDFCPSLANKPKLFFVQASRGPKFDPGHTITLHAVDSEDDSNQLSSGIPVYDRRLGESDRGKASLPTKQMTASHNNIPESRSSSHLFEKDTADDNGLERNVVISIEADFLIAQSTPPGYYSWRNESNGSFFIQSLCATFSQYGDHMELMQMMTMVNRMLSYDFQSFTVGEVSNKKKQISSITSQLTAGVFFTPKKYSSLLSKIAEMPLTIFLGKTL